MGGEGSMSAANVSLKNNRSLLEKRKYRNAKGLLLSEAQKKNINFKKVDPEELLEIKTRIRNNAKRNRRKSIILNSFLVILFLLIGWLIIEKFDGI